MPDPATRRPVALCAVCNRRYRLYDDRVPAHDAIDGSTAWVRFVRQCAGSGKPPAVPAPSSANGSGSL